MGAHFRIKMFYSLVQINYEQSLSELVFTIVDQMARNTTFFLAPMLERVKLAATGNNYADWVRTLRIVLKSAKKDYVLDQPLGDSPTPEMAQDIINVFNSRKDDFSVVKKLMLSCMDPVLQNRFERLSTFEIIEALDVLYHKQDSAEVHKMTKAMEECNINKESLVNEQGVRLANCYDGIAERGINFPKTPGMDLILTSLYEAILKTNEKRMQNQQKLLVKKTASFKKKGKPKGGAKSETVCHYCKGTRHYRLCKGSCVGLCGHH